VTRFQRAFWLAATLVTLVAFGVLVPRLPDGGPDTRRLGEDTTVGLATATVQIPSGWDLDIEATSLRQPLAIKGDVRVAVTDAVWLGASRGLVENAAGLVFSAPPLLPTIPDDASGTDREEWLVLAGPDASADDPRSMTVIRSAESVVLVVVRGPQEDVESVADEIDAIIASVELAGPAVDVEAGA
jgi:hypothetical protein